MAKGKLLWCGCSPGHIGGQARVAQYTIPGLQALGWEVRVCGRGISVIEGGETPVCLSSRYDEHNPDTLKEAIEAFEPDAILFSHDIWLFYCIPALKAQFPKVKFIGWFTIDAEPVHYSWFPILRAMDRVCVSTDFGKWTIYDRFPEKSVGVIKYGVNHDLYHSVFPETKRDLKENFAKQYNLPDFPEACVFTFAGVNQIKKGIGAMVDAFATQQGDAYLVLALKNLPSQIGTYSFDGEHDLRDLVPSGVKIVQLIGAMNNANHAALFQMSDFLLYPSQGEAPGLQISEAQLCGCLPIVTNYTGLPEESCWPQGLITEFVRHRGQFNCIRALIDARTLIGKIQEARDFHRRLGAMEAEACDAYEAFVERVRLKFANRTWAQTALELDESIWGAVSGDIGVDGELLSL